MASRSEQGYLYIPERFERLPITWFTWKIVILAGVAWIMEAIGIGSLGVILPAVKNLWHLMPSQIGLLAAGSTFGIVIGLIPAGYVADYYGRKTVLFWGTITYGVFTLLSALSPSFTILFICRLFAGLGMGATFPLPYAIISEFVSKNRRTLFSGVLDGCLSAGYLIAPLAGMIFVSAIPINLGWRFFLLISALPILYAFLIRAYMPESPRWIEIRKGKADAEQAMQAIEQSVTKSTNQALPPYEVNHMASEIEAVIESEIKSRVHVGDVWKRFYAKHTILSIVTMFSALSMFYIIMNFMPIIFSSKGFSYATSLGFTAIITGSAIPGKLLNGYLSETVGRRPMFIIFNALSGIGALLFSHVQNNYSLMTVYACLMSFFGTGTFPGLKIYYAEQYSTKVRAIGSATVESVSRFLGGVVIPYLVPISMVALGLSRTFNFVAIIAFVGALFMLIFGRETKNRVLEELTLGDKSL